MGRPKAPRRRSPELAWAVTGPLILAAIGLTAIAAHKYGSPYLSGFWLSVLFLGLFCGGQATTLNLEVRRYALTMSVTEVPLLLALFYIKPVTTVVVRALACVIVMAIRRVAPVKIVFNVAMHATAAAAASLIVASAGPSAHFPDADKGPRTWLILMGATFVATLISVSSVIGVITLVQGPMSTPQLLNTWVPGVVVGAINTVVGLAVLLIVQSSWWAIILIAGLAAAIAVIYRGYAQFQRQHRSLAEIYELTKAMSESPYDGTLADVLLHRVRGLLHAESVTLWLPAQGRYPQSLLSSRVDDDGLLDHSATPLLLRNQAFESGQTVAAGPKLGDSVEARTALRLAGVKGAIVVPLRSSGVVIGTLEATGQLHESSEFRDGDVRLLETIAAHASVAVENSRLVDRLRFDAYHDSLTGLPNRRRTLAALEDAIKVKTPDDVVAVILFDVDGLREVNNSLGHSAGDTLLAEFATRLRELSPAAALVTRVGGDEFAVILRVANADAAVTLAIELRDSLRRPMEIGSLSLDVDAAIGIAVHPVHGSDAAVLLQRADVATHAAKSQATALQLFDPSLESRSVRRLGLAGDLRRALDNEALEVYFQPKVSLTSREILGVECLARWEHPVHGAVSPEDFVAVAEHTGQLGRLTDFVLREGLRRCRDWAASGRPLPISVNLSPRSVLDAEFPDRIERLLVEFAVRPDMLTLEITEDGVVSDADRPWPTLNRLHALGVRLSVDDFGTGYSSLSQLRRLPVDEIKIDRSFVQGMATDPGDLAIVRAIVDLARHFGLSVIAEGVESELTLSLLSDVGCDLGQGFLFSRPLPYDRLEAWLAAQTDPEQSAKGEVRRLRAVP
jgi:diguanylate cyclase (GGDEF)-like protein